MSSPAEGSTQSRSLKCRRTAPSRRDSCLKGPRGTRRPAQLPLQMIQKHVLPSPPESQASATRMTTSHLQTPAGTWLLEGESVDNPQW